MQYGYFLQCQRQPTVVNQKVHQKVLRRAAQKNQFILLKCILLLRKLIIEWYSTQFWEMITNINVNLKIYDMIVNYYLFVGSIIIIKYITYQLANAINKSSSFVSSWLGARAGRENGALLRIVVSEKAINNWIFARQAVATLHSQQQVPGTVVSNWQQFSETSLEKKFYSYCTALL